ncbi:MAG: O-methyltransferase [Planctomycetota bacterium]
MSVETRTLDEPLRTYLRELSLRREEAALARLRDETLPLPESQMQISVEQGRLMAVLVMTLGVRRAIEVGVFTGYSSLCVARHLPPDGVLVACDVSDEWTSVARRHWESAGVADRIDLRLGPASETLAAMIAAGEAGTYDFAFIDADKTGYGDYYERCVTLVRSGGLVALDNAFKGGRVVDPEPDDREAIAIRAVTERIFDDERVDPALVPVGDGLLIARKR